MNYNVTVGDQTYAIALERAPSGWKVSVDGGPARHIDLSRPQPDVLSLLIEGASYEVGVASHPEHWEVEVYGRAYRCEVVDPRRAALKLGGGGAQGTLSTSMPGRVVRLLAAVGEVVSAGQPLIVVEAMKMENEIKAPVAGRIAEILVSPGQTVAAGAQLIRIEPE